MRKLSLKTKLETMPETPQHSFFDSIGQGDTNDEPLPQPLKKQDSPDAMEIEDPLDLLIENEISRSPTLTLP
ncbi:hypothetical protein Bca101_058957 [Brassica carinata]